MNVISTNIAGLDKRMAGGIPQGHVVLIAGTSGSMKSSVAYNIAHHHVREGHGKALYISLEQSRESLLMHMERLGMSLEPIEADMTILDLGWLRMELQDEVEGSELDWFQAIQFQIESYHRNIQYDLLVFDSLEAMFVLADLADPRAGIYGFFEKLRELAITALLISEMPPDLVRFGSYGVEAFLADGIIHLDMERTGTTVGRFISVVKMREVRHSTDYFPLLVDEHGFKIVTK